ncbi:hypothetical protein J5X84_44505 [Streptosporangiaceae bacterium NEAU-GS5]|nr:hypothetical protein [Streptosporangiaceae bacterium NEAU-GS5]
MFSVEVEVGNGAEDTLASHIRVWPFGALYLHTEQFGTWLQRRLNPAGYDTRVIALPIDDWTIRWQLWARQHCWSSTDPTWMQGSLSLDLVQKIWGPRRYAYTDVGGPELAVIELPEGDYRVKLQLQRRSHGRPRGRAPKLCPARPRPVRFQWRPQPQRRRDRLRRQQGGRGARSRQRGIAAGGGAGSERAR